MPRRISHHKRKKRRKLKVVAILIIVLSLFIGLLTGIILNTQLKIIEGSLPPDFLSTDGFEKVNSVNIEPPALILSTECADLEMNITEDQLYSIGYALKNMVPTRPLTHDLIKNLLENYNIEILQIKIDSTTSDDIYKAKIIMKQENKVLILDSRPSDATAIALRTGKDLWIKSDILDKFGTNTC
jgi:bifunctional DNase/RNase